MTTKKSSTSGNLQLDIAISALEAIGGLPVGASDSGLGRTARDMAQEALVAIRIESGRARDIEEAHAAIQAESGKPQA
jgi:hypothetical protein